MSGLFLANIAAPFVLSKTGNVFIFTSIIPIETLVIWIVFKQVAKIKIGFPRLLIAVLLANMTTSIIGIPLISESIASSPVVIMFVLPISFFLSYWIEWIVYILFLRKPYQLAISKIGRASFFSNLASYLLFAFFLSYITSNINIFTTGNPARANFELKIPLENYFRAQQGFYLDKFRFAADFKELGLGLHKENQFYRFEMESTFNQASITAIPKLDNISSYRGTVFVLKNKSQSSDHEFVSGICGTKEPSINPPEIPQLINNTFQCPPGTSKMVFNGVRLTQE